MERIESYNGGTIFKIFTTATSFYFFDVVNRLVLSNDSSLLLNLSLDRLSIGCAEICDASVPIDDCDPDSLLSNSGFCLLSNSGDFIIGNA